MARTTTILTPTPEQVEWADCEIGVIFHLDLQVFKPEYNYRNWGSHPDLSIFTPHALDTDQWIATAKAGGAQYAVLVAKHGTGFCLWPTEAHPYSVKHTPWRDGQCDIVGDFIASCAKYGVRPGLYYHCGCNGYLEVDNPGRAVSGLLDDQLRYNRIVERQVTELWTRYGKLFEIWFDGGTLPPEQGGPDVASLLHRLQPNAVCFQGPRGTQSNLRWAGNEQGYVDYPCWSTTRWKPANTDVPHIENAPADHKDAEFPMYGQGDPDGELWAPAENDMTLRRQDQSFEGGWMWRRGEEHLLYPLEEQVTRYYHCVGRNANLLAGLVVDDRGLVPEIDASLWAAFGAEIRRRFAHPVAETAGVGEDVLLTLSAPQAINHVVLMEEIAQGERVRAYTLEGETAAGWKLLASGISIGHKHIERVETEVVSRLRWRCQSSIAVPMLRKLAAYFV